MARIEEIPQPTRDAILGLACSTPDTSPWVNAVPLAQRRVAIVTSAALHRREEPPFPAGSGEFRELPAAVPAVDFVMSHVSINYDRAGYQRDLNVIYPVDRMRELASEGVIAAAADTNFAVMGSTDPKLMSETVDALMARFERDRIDAVLFSPV